MTNTLQLEMLSHCPLCGNDKGFRQLLTATDYESRTGDYPIMICSACGLAFTNPRPTEASIPALYDTRATSDFAPGGKRSLTQKLRSWVIDRYLVKRIPHPSASTIAVLDFGCGDGALAAGVMRHAHRRTMSISITAVDFHFMPPAMLADCGPEVRYVNYWHWKEESARYDVIFLRHVLEHHPEPTRLLEELSKALTPAGVLHVEVPNRRSVWAHIFGKYFFAYYVPRHLLHFDEKSLSRTIQAGGLSVLDVQQGHTPLIGKSLGYALSRDIDNLGVVGLLSYLPQVLLDLVFGRSTTLRVAARK
jgi:SAM-dependent methyltransferase